MPSTVIFGGYYGAGPEAVQIVVVSATGVLSPNTFTEVNASGGNVVETLPPVANPTALWVSRTDTAPGYVATVVTAEGGLVEISGASVLVLTPGVGYLIVSNGTQWTLFSDGGGGGNSGNPNALLSSNNLDDVNNPVVARLNLGLGTAATAPLGAFDPAGSANTAELLAVATSNQKAANLGDVANVSLAVANLGLTNAVTSSSGGVNVAAGLVTLAPITLWAPFTAYTAGQLVISQSGAFAVGVSSLMQCKFAHTSTGVIGLTNWLELADLNSTSVAGHTSGTATATTSDTGVMSGGRNLTMAGSASAATSDTGAATSSIALANTALTLWDNTSATGLTTLAVAPTAVGDLMMFTAVTNPTGSAINTITGGGVTTWTRLGAPSETAPGTLEVWFGQVATAGASTITVTWSLAPTYTEFTAQQFHSTLGASSAWTVINDAANVPPGIATAMATTLVPATANTQLVWAFFFPSGAGSAGTTSGFTYAETQYGNEIAYNLASVNGTSYTPNAVQSPSGNYLSFLAVMSPVPVAPSPPAFVSPPTITGTAQVPYVLTAVSGSTTGSPSPTDTWQWFRSGVAITGILGTEQTYTQVTADVGHTLTVIENATNGSGTASLTSAATSAVLAAGASGGGDTTGPFGPAPLWMSVIFSPGSSNIITPQSGVGWLTTAVLAYEKKICHNLTWAGCYLNQGTGWTPWTTASTSTTNGIGIPATFNGWPTRITPVISTQLNAATGTGLGIIPSSPSANDTYWSAWFTSLNAFFGPAGLNIPQVQIRLGIEDYFSSSFYQDSPFSSPNTTATYVAYMQHIITLARGINSTLFKFSWNCWGPGQSGDMSTAYPGDSYIDVFTSDFYDGYNSNVNNVPNATVTASNWAQWDSGSNGPTDATWTPHNLQGLAAYATAHGKPWGFDEWGMQWNAASDTLYGAGDDITFMNDMVGVLDSIPAGGYASYFESGDGSGGGSLLFYPGDWAFPVVGTSATGTTLTLEALAYQEYGQFYAYSSSGSLIVSTNAGLKTITYTGFTTGTNPVFSGVSWGTATGLIGAVMPSTAYSWFPNSLVAYLNAVAAAAP